MPAVVRVAEHFEGLEMVFFRARFFEDFAKVCRDYGVGGDDERGFGEGVDGGLVDVCAFCLGGGEDVFEGAEGFGLVFGDGGGEDFEVCEADLEWEERWLSMGSYNS